MASLESNIIGLWAAAQPDGKGVPADMTAATKSFRWVGGDVEAARDDGSEPYSDNTLFGDSVDFVNTISGNGAPVIQMQSGPLAYLSWLAAGQETVTAGVNAQHTISSSAASGTFKLNLNGYITADIPFNAAASAIVSALQAAVNRHGKVLPAGSFAASGGPLPTGVVLTFQGALGAQPVPAMVVDGTGLTGGAVTIVATTRLGVGNKHVITPNDSGGFYSTWVKSVGRSVNVRQQFNDCIITTLRFEGSSAAKVCKVTPTFLSFDPGEVLAVDPTQGDDGSVPFIWTEAQGQIIIDGQVYRGSSSFAMESQWSLTPWYGDDVVPFDVTTGRATVVLQAITILLDATGLTNYNEQIYGTPTPPANAKPIHYIPALGSYAVTYSKKSRFTGGVAETAEFEVPAVKWDPNLTIPANVAGGPVELPLAGEQRKDPDALTQPAWRVTITNPFDTAFSV